MLHEAHSVCGRVFVRNSSVGHIGPLYLAAALAKGTRLSRTIGEHLESIGSHLMGFLVMSSGCDEGLFPA